MLTNFIKIAIRALLKQRIYSIINMLGLSIGIASCLLIVLYVSHELSYDQFHTRKDRLYKMALERKYPNHATNYAVIPHSFADVMVTDFPEVEATVKMGGPFNDVPVIYHPTESEERVFEEDFIMAADSNFFNIFSFKIIQGDPDKVFTNRSELVVTQETAQRYFGNDEPIGKVLHFFGQDFKVSGVCENIPQNSHFRFNVLIRAERNTFGRDPNFTGFDSHVYVLLQPGADASALEAKFPAMVDRYAASAIEQELGKSWEDYKKEGNGYRYFLQPLTGIHLDPTNIEAKITPGGNIQYVYFLSGIAILIIVIACINFMNLATARSAERSREVGVRKTLGSMKTQLVYQFLTESIILSCLSTLTAVLIVSLILPYFNELVDRQFSLSFSPMIIIELIALSLVVGVLAGSYPAFALSSFNPAMVLKGSFSGNRKGVGFRNTLVVFQFFVSILLITGTLVVSKQMQFMQSKSLGYNKDQILIVERLFTLGERMETFMDEVRELPGVDNAAKSFALLGRQRDFFGAFYLPEGNTEVLTVKSMVIGDELAATVGFEFVEGHGYSRETNDSLSIMLNEAAVKALGLSNPVGKKIYQVQRAANGTVNVQLTIIGVIRDFNFQTLRDPITPLAIPSIETFGGGGVYAYARINASDLSNVVASVEEKWKTFVPDQPFKYQFLDQNLAAQYESEKTAGATFAVFSGLAIIIACVGLFGLTAYTALQRTKEIGVRKVLGASVPGVVLLLSRDFTKLVLIAFVLAVPLAWYIMSNWLQGFAYRIDLGIGIFFLSGIITIIIAWVTVSFQAVKAAMANPISSLRSE